MSVNITIVGPDSIWMCSDHRLTDLRTGNQVDTENKQVLAYTPDGSLLIGWVGIGKIRPNLGMDRWVAETISNSDQEISGIPGPYCAAVVHNFVKEANDKLASSFSRVKSSSGRWLGHHWFIVAMAERRL